jgi:hypothetical protein
MIWTEKTIALVLGSLLLATTVEGVSNDPVSQERNYQVIIDRNPFGLKPAPPPPTNTPPVVTQPKDEILLTGIASIGSVRAYFMTKAPQGKEPDYYSLGVDEKKDDLEVTFASHGPKPPATPSAPAPGAQPPGTPRVPGALPGVASLNLPGSPATASSATTVRTMDGTGRTAGAGRIRTIPSRSVRTQVPVMDPIVAQRYGITPEGEPNPQPAQPDPNAAIQDVLMMELQKRANPDVVFPPTPLP